MNKIYLLIKSCLFTMILSLFAACTEKETVLVPVFPEEEAVLNVNSFDTAEVIFSANMDWVLTSSSIWCKFSNGFTTLRGNAGEQKVELFINDDMLTFEESISEITLKMGNESKVIAKVYRAPLEYKLTVLLDDNETVCSEANPAQILYGNVQRETTISLTTNFNWKFSNVPEWLVIDEQMMQGQADEQVYITLSLNDKNIILPQNDVISVLDKTGEVRGYINVVYDGMPSGGIEFSVSNPWTGFTFSADAKKYSVGALTTGEIEMLDAPLEISVFDNIDEELQPYFMRLDEYGMSDFDPWMNKNWGKVTLENNTIKFTAEVNSGEERELALLLLPKSICENVYADMLTEPDAEGAYYLKEEYEKYFVTVVKQSSLPLDIKVTAWSNEQKTDLLSYTPSEKNIDDETALGLCGGCSLNNIKVISLKKGTAYDKIEIQIDALQEGMWEISSPVVWNDSKNNVVNVNPSDIDPKTIVVTNITSGMPYTDSQEMVIPITSFSQGYAMPYAGIIFIRE